ncbi:hypothetical protein [Actinoplanes sp. NPDC049118]|uniref:hypothetical protein n=1 Tax=Actinoplanes sp. NPDC049118 TaxID=3155769 RepID=UPI0033C7C3F5
MSTLAHRCDRCHTGGRRDVHVAGEERSQLLGTEPLNLDRVRQAGQLGEHGDRQRLGHRRERDEQPRTGLVAVVGRPQRLCVANQIGRQLLQSQRRAQTQPQRVQDVAQVHPDAAAPVDKLGHELVAGYSRVG